MTNTSNKILTINNLTKIYHTLDKEIYAIKNLNLEINEGDFIAVVGPSGCGKSTLLSILSNIEKKSSGDIIFKNNNIKCGYMPQEDTLFPWLNIIDNCMIGLKIKKEDTKENKEKIIKMLEDYGLKDFIKSYPSNLSGGMRKRVALIRTMATSPDILLLDEAFSALDYQTRIKVSDDIWKIIKKEKKTAIMVTHNIEEAITMADKVVILSSRPATVKKIYDINLTNKTTPINNRKCKEYNYYYDEIWKEIDSNV